MHERIIIFLLLATSVTAGAAPDFVADARAAANWLESVAVETEHGLTWTAAPETTDESPSISLYSGAPGPILLFLELHRRRGTPTSPDLTIAQRAANDLLTRAMADLQTADCGLYTGLAGVGFVLLEVADACADAKDVERYRAGAHAVFTVIRFRGERTEAGSRWGPANDIIAGSAGIIVAQLDAARRFEASDHRFASLLRLRARKAGLELLAVAESEASPRGPMLRWPMTTTLDRRYPNFSHGTAGIGFALLRLDQDLREREPDVADRFRAAALGAARRLDDLARQDDAGGLIRHHEPGGETLFYLGWCHGPTGTARFYTLLAEQTGDDAWLDRVDRAASVLQTQGLPAGRTPGYWNNVGRCCGAAGIADALREHHVRTGDEPTIELARALTADMLARATVEVDEETGVRRLKWIQAEHRARPELLQAQTGLMQGASGIGLWLLRLDAHEHGRPYYAILPDELPETP